MTEFQIIDASAILHIKNLVDNVRCAVCDKLNETRVRYTCGHTCCEDCAVAAVDCPICLLPQETFQEPIVDKPLTKRVANAVQLLNALQDELHIDVYKRQRLSEQLKIEKELFPECIQAPVKYVNKRKSLQNSIKKKKHNNKENKLSQLPGEEISSSLYKKMDQSNVEQWLHKYVRKPLAVLNTNDESLHRYSGIKTNNQTAVVDTENIQSLRKRPYNKTTSSNVENQSNPNKQTPTKKLKSTNLKTRKNVKTSPVSVKQSNKAKNDSFCDKNVTSIDLSEEEDAVVIDDSQSVKVDKDEAALRAVYEAEHNIEHDSPCEITSKSSDSLLMTELENIKEKEIIDTPKVPIHLKSNLSDTCHNSTVTESESKVETIEQKNNVSIRIESKSFTTTIKVVRIENTRKEKPEKKSVEVQTELIINNEGNYNDIDHNIEFVETYPKACSSQSQDLLMEFRKDEQAGTNIINKTDKVIIEESDTDEDHNESLSFSVTADVHRSCEENDYGILSVVENLEAHSNKTRRAARGHTPASTDSSEKENFNPNRLKKTLKSKKKTIKK